jgi:hypothetical protein
LIVLQAYSGSAVFVDLALNRTASEFFVRASVTVSTGTSAYSNVIILPEIGMREKEKERARKREK